MMSVWFVRHIWQNGVVVVDDEGRWDVDGFAAEASQLPPQTSLIYRGQGQNDEPRRANESWFIVGVRMAGSSEIISPAYRVSGLPPGVSLLNEFYQRGRETHLIADIPTTTSVTVPIPFRPHFTRARPSLSLPIT